MQNYSKVGARLLKQFNRKCGDLEENLVVRTSSPLPTKRAIIEEAGLSYSIELGVSERERERERVFNAFLRSVIFKTQYV